MDPIRFFNRYSGEVEEEAVYGEGFLKFAYGNPLGRLALHALVKRALFSKWYGWRMDRAKSAEKVLPFIRDFKLDAGEFLERPETFGSFNAFFSRRLKPEARPVDDDPHSLVFPADGRHFVAPDISQMDGIFVKGRRFDLGALLGEAGLAEKYGNGSLLISRLCPTDYHRFHFPSGGVPGKVRNLPGPLFSVNPIAVARDVSIFWTNKRAVTAFRTSYFRTIQMIEVGATCVGSIVQTHPPDKVA